MTGKISGKKKKALIAASVIAVAAILIVPAAFAFFGQSSPSGVNMGSYAQSGLHTITYNYGDGTQSMTANYYGIAATEYNPSYWVGYVDETALVNGTAAGQGNPLYNWTGPSEIVGITLSSAVASTSVTAAYAFSVQDGSLYLGDLNVTDAVDSAVNVEVFSIKYGAGYSITGLSEGTTDYTWGQKNFQLTIANDTVNNKITGSIKSGGSDGTSVEGANVTVPFSMGVSSGSIYYLRINKVFAGWYNADEYTSGKIKEENGLVNPGDVVSNTVTSLDAIWEYPDIFLNQSKYHVQSDEVVNGEIVTVMNPGKAAPYKVITTIDNTSDTNTYVKNGVTYTKASVVNNVVQVGGMYRTIYAMYKDSGSVTGKGSPDTGTYRDLHAIDSTLAPNITRFAYSNRVTQNGDVVIDNLTMDVTVQPPRHGDATGGDFTANYYKLILGTGLNMYTDYVDTNKGQLYGAPAIHGGNNTESTAKVIEQKSIVSAVDGDLNGYKVDLGTYVIVHSGVYANAFASGCAAIGNGGNTRSAYMVMKGGFVLDTIGGSGLKGSGTEITGGSGDLDTAVQGGTFLYCVGVKTPGTSYQDKVTGWADEYCNGDGTVSDGVHGIDAEYMIREESCIVHGGGANGRITGCAHLFISGKSSIFDAQGGGRRGTSTTSHTYVEISGKAEVRHVACGTITDGIEGADRSKSCVGGVDMIVADDATVGILLGAGYDTYSASDYSSMNSGNIRVKIYGGTIGYVYGGGFRGSIGTNDNDRNPGKVNITIDMYGGTVVNDLFGGGRGGLDKVHNNPVVGNKYGSILRDPGKNNGYLGTTGISMVYGDITINLHGGTVEGNVYGGGESLPSVGYYFGDTINGKTILTAKPVVAGVEGNITINIDGVTVNGDVFGSGKGISTKYSSDSTVLLDPDTDDYVTVDISNVNQTGDEPNKVNRGDSLTSFKMPYYATTMIYNGHEFVYTPWILPTYPITANDVEIESNQDYDTVKNVVAGKTSYNGATLSNVSYTKSGFTVKAMCGSKNIVNSNPQYYTFFAIKDNETGYVMSVSGSTPVTLCRTTNTYVLDLVTSYMSEYKMVTENPTAAGMADYIEERLPCDTKVSYASTGYYAEYANVTGTVTVNMIDGVVTGTIYGGGEISKTYSVGKSASTDATQVNIEGGYVHGDVYGGGLGRLNKTSVTGISSVVVASSHAPNAGTSLTTVGYADNGDHFGMKVIGADTYSGRAAIIDLLVGKTYTLEPGKSGTLAKVNYTKSGFQIDAVTTTIDGRNYTFFVMEKDDVTIDCTMQPIVTSSKSASAILGFIADAFSGATYLDVAESLGAALTEEGDQAWGDEWVVGGYIGGSVYGGAENGIVSGTKVYINGGYVTNNVFGGGLGDSEINSVTGDIKVYINGGYIGGSVYGGAAYGLTTSDMYVYLNGGRVVNDVYGGGLGRATKKSTTGRRAVIINDQDTFVDSNGNVIKYIVGGNVYGSSSEGDDGSDGGAASNSYIYIESGAIRDSVFGGGFMGETWGLTQVWLGYVFHGIGQEPLDIEDPGDDPENVIAVVESVYLGGNVKTDGEGSVTPYTETLVHGVSGQSSETHINGRYADIRVGGAIMGSGNSCLTGGKTKLTASYFLDPEEMDGIHYFTKVRLFESILHISGRETYFGSSASVCSVSHIGELTLQDGSSLFISNKFDDVGSLNSLTRDNTATTTSSPFNKIVFTSGSTMYLRSMNGNTVTSYGMVTGYTIITVADNAPYGGYVLGSKDSTGGFVIMRDGTYTIADKSNFVSTIGVEEVHICCWFISGVENRSITLTLPSDTAFVRGSVDITKLQDTSDIRYVGGTYVSSSDKYDFYRPGLCADEYFGLMFGFMNGDDDRMLLSDTTHYFGFNSALTTWRSATYYLDGTEIVVEPDTLKGEDEIINGVAKYWDGYRYSVVDADGKMGIKFVQYNETDFNTKKVNLAAMLNESVKVNNKQFHDFGSFSSLGVEGKAVYVELHDSIMVYFVMRVGDYMIDCSTEGLIIATKDASDQSAPVSLTSILSIFSDKLKVAGTNGWTRAELASEIETVLESQNNRAWVKGWDVSTSGEVTTLAHEYMWTSSKYIDPTILQTGSVTNTPAQGDTMAGTFTPSSGQGEYTLNFQFCGANISTTTYLGYVILHFQEVNIIEYEVSGTVQRDYIVSNLIDVRVDLYAVGETVEANYELDLYSVDGAGSVDMIIPDGNTNNVVWVDSWATTEGDHDTALTLRGTKNVGKTNGWKDTVGSKTIYGTGNDGFPLGTLSGGYMATLNYSVANYDYDGTTIMVLNLVMKDAQGNILTDGQGHEYRATVTIEIYEREKIIITFYDEDQGIGEGTGGVIREVSYGTLLQHSDCPPTAENFLDWYTDRDFHNTYDFNTVVTKSFSLYARYTYTVTFDYMDGTSSSMYVNSSRVGSVIMSPPADPTRAGYTFAGWYKQSACLEPWVFGADGDIVTGNTTLYAKWIGQNVRLVFEYTDSQGNLRTLPYIIVPLTDVTTSVTKVGADGKTTFTIPLDRQGYSVGDKVIYDIRIKSDLFAALELTFVSGDSNPGTFQVYNQKKVSYALPIGYTGDLTVVFNGYAMQQGDKCGVYIGNGLHLTDKTNSMTAPTAGNTDFSVTFDRSGMNVGDRFVLDVMINGRVYDAEFNIVSGSGTNVYTFDTETKLSFNIGVNYTGAITFNVDGYTAQQGDSYKLFYGDGTETITGPFVRYGNTFNVVDIQHSGYLGTEITFLDRARAMVESELNGQKFIKWTVEHNGFDVPIYSDTVLDDRILDISSAAIVDGQPVIVLRAITKAVAMEIVMEGLTEDLAALIADDKVDPDWADNVNTSDLSATVRAPSTRLVYPEEDVAQGILNAGEYLFKFELNDATRPGWYLTGWHSTHLDYHNALNPTAGNVRYVKIVTPASESDQSVTAEYLFTGDTTLTGQDLDNALANPNNWVAMEPNEGGSLNDPANPYIIRYVARWERIEYTFTVRDSGHGVTDAYLVNTVTGEETRGTTFTPVYYGDRIKLIYTTESRYEFYKWNIIGECEIEDLYAAETTVIVTGDCVIFASDSGERVVRLYMQYDGGIAGAKDAIFLKDAEGEYTELDKSPNAESTNFVLYREYALKGVYSIIIRETVDEGLPTEREIEYVVGEIDIGNEQPVFYFDVISFTLQITDHELELNEEPDYDVDLGNGVEAYSKYVGRNMNSGATVSAFIEVSAGYQYHLEEGLWANGEYSFVKDINQGTSETMIGQRESFYLSETNTAGRAIRGFITPIKYTVEYYVGDDWLIPADAGKTVTVNNAIRTVNFNDTFNIVTAGDITIDQTVMTNTGYKVFGFYGDNSNGNYTIAVNNDTVLNSALLTTLGDRVSNHHIVLYAHIIYNVSTVTINVNIKVQGNNGDNNYYPIGVTPVQFIEDASDGRYHAIHRFPTDEGFTPKAGDWVFVYADDVLVDSSNYTFTETDGDMSFYILKTAIDGKTVRIDLDYDRMTARLNLVLGGQVQDVLEGWTYDSTERVYYKMVRYGDDVVIPTVTTPVDYEYEGWTEDGNGSFIISQQGVYTYKVALADVIAYNNNPSARISVTPIYTPVATVTAIFVTSIGRFRDGSQRVTLTLTRHQNIRAAIEPYLYQAGDKMAPSTEGFGDYTFLQWSPDVPDSFADIPNENSRLFVAQWQAPLHTLTFSVGGEMAQHIHVSATNDSSNLPAESGSQYSHHAGIIITVKVTPGIALDMDEIRAHMSTGGVDIGEPTALDDITYRWSFFLDSDVSITFYGKTVTIPVHFLVNGGLFESVQETKYQTITFKQYVISEYPELEGYDCDGEWYTDPECTQVYSDYTIVDGKRVYSFLVLEETTFYTKVTAHVYYVWFNPNGAEVPQGQATTLGEVRVIIDNHIQNGTALPNYIQEFTVGRYPLLNALEYERPGYIFAGWALESDGQVTYLRNERISDDLTLDNYVKGGSGSTGVVTLYAWYLKISNTVDLQNFLYDGQHHYGSIVNGSYTGLDESFVVKYSKTQISSIDQGTAVASDVYFVDAGTWVVNYYGYVQIGDDVNRRYSFIGFFNIIIKAREVTFISGSTTAVADGTPVVNRTFTWQTGANIGIVGNEGQGLTAIFDLDTAGWPTTVGVYNNTFSVTFDGTTIKASNYKVIGYTAGTITLTTASAVIDIGTSITKTYGDASFDVVAQSTDPTDFPASGFVYTVLSNDGAVTITDKVDGGKTVSIVRSGTATIRIFIDLESSQEQTPIANTYTDVTITVNKKTITVTISVQDAQENPNVMKKTYDRTADFSGTLVYVVNGAVNSDNVTVVANVAYDGIHAGSHSLLLSNCRFTGEGGWSDKYTISSYTTSIAGGEILQRTITVTAPTASKDYDGTALTATTCTITGTFPTGEGFSVLPVAIGAITNVDAGQTTGTATNGFSQNPYTLNNNTSAGDYNIVLVTGTLTINQVKIEKPHVVGSYKYNMMQQSVVVGPSSSFYTVLHDPGRSIARATDVGTYTVLIQLNCNDVENNVFNVLWADSSYADVSLTWSITQETMKENLFRLATNTYEYKGAAWEPTVIVDPDPVSGNTYQLGVDYTVTYQNNKESGSATVIITGSANYGSPQYYKYFTITKVSINISVTSMNKFVYDGESRTLVYFNEALLVDVDRAERPEVYATNATIKDVGTYESVFTAKFANGDVCDNYTFTIVSYGGSTFTRTVTPRTAYLVISSAWKEYDGTALTSNSYKTIGIFPADLGTVESPNLTVTITSTITAVGTVMNYGTVVTSGPIANNYTLNVLQGTLTVLDSSYVEVTLDDGTGRGALGAGIEANEELSRNTVTTVNVPSRKIRI